MDFYDLTPPKTPREEQYFEPYPATELTSFLLLGTGISLLMGGGIGVVSMIFFALFFNTSFSAGFFIGFIPTGILFFALGLHHDAGPIFAKIDLHKWGKAAYRNAYAQYERDMAAWPAELERRKRANEAEAGRRAEEEAKRQRAREQAQAEALRWQREEEGRRRQAAEAEARRKAWEEAFQWAKATLEQEYHGLAVRLAATLGQLSQEDILKVFVSAYPHMTCSSDWRIGCLRELAESDPRITAILPFLPPSDARNTRPP